MNRLNQMYPNGSYSSYLGHPSAFPPDRYGAPQRKISDNRENGSGQRTVTFGSNPEHSQSLMHEPADVFNQQNMEDICEKQQIIPRVTNYSDAKTDIFANMSQTQTSTQKMRPLPLASHHLADQVVVNLQGNMPSETPSKFPLNQPYPAPAAPPFLKSPGATLGPHAFLSQH